jgi:hypothetical protein
MEPQEKRKLPPIDSEILICRMANLTKLVGNYLTGIKYSDADLGRICGLIEGYLVAFEVFERGSLVNDHRLEVNHKIFGIVYQKYESYHAMIYRYANEFLTKYPPQYPDSHDEEADETPS